MACPGIPCNKKETVVLKSRFVEPSVWKQLENFYEAMFRFAHAKQKFVAKTTLKHRADICQGCDERKGMRCAACGCFIKFKVTLSTEVCPKGKWS